MLPFVNTIQDGQDTHQNSEKRSRDAEMRCTSKNSEDSSFRGGRNIFEEVMQQNDQIIQHLRGEKTSIQDDLVGKGQRVLNLEGEMREKDMKLEIWANEKAEMERASQEKDKRLEAGANEKAEMEKAFTSCTIRSG